MTYAIPFNRPALMGRELEYMADALRSGHASGDGPYTRRSQALRERITCPPRVLLTPSCTRRLLIVLLSRMDQGCPAA